MGPNARFGYPLRGGFQALMDGWLPHLKGELRTGHAGGARLAAQAHGHAEQRRGAPLRAPDQHHAAAGADPPDGRGGAGGDPRRGGRVCATSRCAACTSASAARISPRSTGSTIPRTRCSTASSSRAMPARIAIRPGGFGLTCEITYSPHKPLPCDGDELMQRCIEDCHKVGHLPARGSGVDRGAVRHAVRVRGLRSRPRRSGRRASASGWRSMTSCSRAATASGSITTPTTRSWPERRPRIACRSGSRRSYCRG